MFRVALTGDFLNEAGSPAYGGHGLDMLEHAPHVQFHFLMRHAPPRGDRSYWDNFYSLEVSGDEIADLDGLIVLRPRVQRAALEQAAKHLVVIGRSGAGYDKVDVDACTEYDIALFNVPHALDHSTASTALMFMLALVKRLPQQERITRAGRWDKQAEVMGTELRGRTLGILGLGQSGRELVRLVAPFEMHVLAYSPHADPHVAAALGVRLLELDELLRAADIVSIHARLRDDNRRLIGPRQLALLKPSAYLINVARGELIDQAALVDVLRKRGIAGAALDVFEREPLPADDPLVQLDNVILTPHWSASTTDIWRATGETTARGMLQAACGKVPNNVVNPQVLDKPGFQKKLARFRGQSVD